MLKFCLTRTIGNANSSAPCSIFVSADHFEAVIVSIWFCVILFLLFFTSFSIFLFACIFSMRVRFCSPVFTWSLLLFLNTICYRPFYIALFYWNDSIYISIRTTNTDTHHTRIKLYKQTYHIQTYIDASAREKENVGVQIADCMNCSCDSTE